MRLVVIAVAGLIATGAHADGLFMHSNWSGFDSQRAAGRADLDPRTRSEDTPGVSAGKKQRASPQVPFFGQPYAGRFAFDGICDAYQPQSWQTEGVAAGLNMGYPPYVLYTPAGNCATIVYPGFSFFFYQPNVALAPHYVGDMINRSRSEDTPGVAAGKFMTGR